MGVYTYLDDDLAAVGIELNNSERDRLGKIVSLLNSGNTTQANQLMNQFIADWRYDDLTPDEAQTLFDADMTHQMDFLNGRLRSLLGRVDGDRVYQSLQETREMIGVMSLFYNSQNLVGSGLARAFGMSKPRRGMVRKSAMVGQTTMFDTTTGGPSVATQRPPRLWPL